VKCLHCGYCCYMFSVAIPSGTEKAPREETDLEMRLGGRGERCKHLRGSVPGRFKCVLHDKRWYKQTPCYRHGQVEQGDRPCRMGVYVLADPKRQWFLTKEESQS